MTDETKRILEGLRSLTLTELTDFPRCTSSKIKAAVDLIERLSTVDVVPCERCRAWGESPIPNYKETGWCNIMMNHTEPDFFCAFGAKLERKDSTRSNMIE